MCGDVGHVSLLIRYKNNAILMMLETRLAHYCVSPGR